jgi:prepilin-type N-terminal cleavage/methylation domain-containing protein
MVDWTGFPQFGVPGVNRRAFTLVELVVVVLLMGIFAAVATPKFNAALSRSRVEAACQRIKADLAWARQTALTKSAAQAVEFFISPAKYTVTGVADLDRSTAAYSIALDDTTYRTSVVSATLGSDAIVQFDRYGQPDSGGTITLRSGGVTRTVTIDAATGVASTP